MVKRTRYKENRPTLYFNYNGGGTTSLTKSHEYLSSNVWKFSSNTSAPNSSVNIPGGFNVNCIIDEQYSAAEKSQLPKTGKRELKSKYVDHWKSTLTGGGGGAFTRPFISPGIRNQTLNFVGLPLECRSYWTFNKYTLDKAPHPIYDTSDTLSSNHQGNAFQRLSSDARLLNLHDQNIFTTIGELKDFKKTIQTVTRHVLKDKRYVADKYLGVNFGIIPFYQDMKKYVENYNNFAPNLKKWNDLGFKGKILNSHCTIFKKKSREVFGFKTSNFSWSGGGSYHYRFEYDSSINVVAKASMYFKARPLHAQDENALLRSINGISKPFTAAWNLIPFSFLVDWFVNVGDKIEEFEYHRPVVKFDILDGCTSLKIDQTIECKVYVVDNLSGSELFLGDTRRVFKSYKRTPHAAKYIKDIIDSVGISSPLEFTTELSGYQWSLAAALAVTNFPRKK